MAIIGGIYTTGELSADLASGTGITLTTGHAKVSSILYANGAAIEAALTGDTWDDLVDINLGVPFEFTLSRGSSAVVWPFLHARVALDETNGDYLRLQVEIDGVVKLDFTNTSNAVNNIDNYFLPLLAGSLAAGANPGTQHATHKMFANSRFRIRAWKNGTFDGASYLYIAQVNYNKITV